MSTSIYNSPTTYVTYITFYKGNRLPPFYIGYSTKTKVLNGYHGSVRSFKYRQVWEFELKNNPQLFKTKIISTFSTKKEALNHEEYLHSFFNVAHNELYINKRNSNQKFNNTGGYKLTNSTKEKMKKSFTKERLESMSKITSKLNKKRWNDDNYKTRVSQSISKSLRGRKSKYKGISRSESDRNKISVGTKNAMNDPTLRKHLSDKAKNRCTDEWRERIRQENKIRLSCRYCRKETSKANLSRHQNSKRCIKLI